MKWSNIYKYHATQEIVFVITIKINLLFISSHAVTIIQILNIRHYSNTTKCIGIDFFGQNNSLFCITFQHLNFLLFVLLLNVEKKGTHIQFCTQSQ